MKIKYFAQVSDWTGCAEEAQSLDAAGGMTVRQLLVRLAASHGDFFRERIYDPELDRQLDDVFILLNGKHLSRLDGLDTLIGEGDVLAVIPVMEAG